MKIILSDNGVEDGLHALFIRGLLVPVRMDMKAESRVIFLSRYLSMSISGSLTLIYYINTSC